MWQIKIKKEIKMSVSVVKGFGTVLGGLADLLPQPTVTIEGETVEIALKLLRTTEEGYKKVVLNGDDVRKLNPAYVDYQSELNFPGGDFQAMVCELKEGRRTVGYIALPLRPSYECEVTFSSYSPTSKKLVFVPKFEPSHFIRWVSPKVRRGQRAAVEAELQSKTYQDSIKLARSQWLVTTGGQSIIGRTFQVGGVECLTASEENEQMVTNDYWYYLIAEEPQINWPVSLPPSRVALSYFDEGSVDRVKLLWKLYCGFDLD